MNKLPAIILPAISVIIVVILYFFNNSIDLVGGISVKPDSVNVHRVTIDIELRRPAGVIVKYWKDASNVLCSPSSPVKVTHQIKLVGLSAMSEYRFVLLFSNDQGETSSSEYRFKTGKSRHLMPIEWLKKPGTSYRGYVLTQRRLVSGSIYLLNNAGEVVWYHDVPGQPKLSHWTAQHTILVMYGNASHRNSAGDMIAAYDLYGQEHLYIDLNDIETPIEGHHEVRYDHNQNLLVLAYDKKVVDLSALGGSSSTEVLGDAIVVLDKEGRELWRWSVFDYADPVSDENILKNAADWSHANSLSIDHDGGYLVSFRNWNQVWKIDAISGAVVWKLGENGNIQMVDEGYFSGQHAVHVNSKGEYMVFDNGLAKRKTRVLSFDIDEANKIAHVKMNIPLPDEFYTDRMGSAYLIEHDNLLICTPRTNAIMVIDSTGTVLSHVRLGLPAPYRAEYIPSITSLYPSKYGQ